jgi:membrane associated rhomboid family serine protease
MNDFRRPPRVPEAPREPTLFEHARRAPVTYGLAALNVVVFLVLESKYSSVWSTDGSTLIEAGANQPAHLLIGEYWRVATYMFLHIGWLHLGWNIYASIGFCEAVERALGRARFLGVYLLSGIGGGCVSALVSHPMTVSAGASGALFGIVGAMLAIRRRTLPSFAAFFKDPSTRSILFNIALWMGIGSIALRMDNAAHVGGLLVGFAATWMVTSRRAHFASLVFATAFGALLIFTARPWHKPTPEETKVMTSYAAIYLKGMQGFHVNLSRAYRFASKACNASDESGALACQITRELETR